MPSSKHDMSSAFPPFTAESVAPQSSGPRHRRDVTRRYEALVQLAPDATVVVDARGRIRLVNRQTEELFGYSAEDLLNQPVELLIPERLRAVHQQHRTEYSQAPRVRHLGAHIP